MKRCSKCKIEKPFEEFGVRKKASDGRKSACKVCLRSDNRAYYNTNIEKESLRKKKQYDRDKDKIIAQQLEYYGKNKERRSYWVKKKRQEQPEVFNRYSKTYRTNNKENVNTYFRERRQKDPFFKVKHCLRRRLGGSLEAKFWNKANTFKEYIGCTLEELKLHLEKQFQPGMTWENHGMHGWHIDHIIPLSSAKNEAELYKLCHYTNLQPLWAIDNLKKGSKEKARDENLGL